MLTKRLDRRLWAGPLLGAMLGWESDGGGVGRNRCQRVKRGAHENVARARRRKMVRDCDKVCDFCRAEVNEKNYKTQDFQSRENLSLSTRFTSERSSITNDPSRCGSPSDQQICAKQTCPDIPSSPAHRSQTQIIQL